MADGGVFCHPEVDQWFSLFIIYIYGFGVSHYYNARYCNKDAFEVSFVSPILLFFWPPGLNNSSTIAPLTRFFIPTFFHSGRSLVLPTNYTIPLENQVKRNEQTSPHAQYVQ